MKKYAFIVSNKKCRAGIKGRQIDEFRSRGKSDDLCRLYSIPHSLYSIPHSLYPIPHTQRTGEINSEQNETVS